MSKIGLQSQSGVIQDLPRLLAKKPIAWLLLGNALNVGIAQQIRELSPQTFIALRTGGNWAVDDDSFIPRYCDEAARLADPFLQRGYCDLLLPPNEPIVFTPDLAKLLNDRQVQFAVSMKARGYRVGAYNFSVGNPQYSLWPFLLDGIRASDNWLLLHEYGGKGMQDSAGDLALRHRNVFPLLPPDIQANLKIGITESGIDLGAVGGAGGYKRYYPTNDTQESIDPFLRDLTWYDSELAKDPYVKFVNLFGYAMNEPWVGLGFDIAEIDTERAKYINWQQAGVVDLGGNVPPPPPPPTGGSMTTAEKRSADGFNAAGVAYNKDAAIFKYAQANALGYPVTNEYEATYDGAVWVNQGYAAAIVGCVKGDWGNVRAFDWLTGAPYVPPTTQPPTQPPSTIPPFSVPPILPQYGMGAREGVIVSGLPFFRLTGAAIHQGVSAFCKVTVIGKNGVPVIGAHVINKRPDGNFEDIQTDGSGVVQFNFGAGSAFTTPGTGPFTVYVATGSDFAVSLGDYQGLHTEITLQFVQVQ